AEAERVRRLHAAFAEQLDAGALVLAHVDRSAVIDRDAGGLVERARIRARRAEPTCRRTDLESTAAALVHVLAESADEGAARCVRRDAAALELGDQHLAGRRVEAHLERLVQLPRGAGRGAAGDTTGRADVDADAADVSAEGSYERPTRGE